MTAQMQATGYTVTAEGPGGESIEATVTRESTLGQTEWHIRATDGAALGPWGGTIRRRYETEEEAKEGASIIVTAIAEHRENVIAADENFAAAISVAGGR